MTLVLELSAELEKELAKAADEAGLSLEDYTLRLLAMRSSGASQLKNGADIVAYWRRLGIIGMRSDIHDSQEHAREIRRAAERRQNYE